MIRTIFAYLVAILFFALFFLSIHCLEKCCFNKLISDNKVIDLLFDSLKVLIVTALSFLMIYTAHFIVENYNGSFAKFVAKIWTAKFIPSKKGFVGLEIGMIIEPCLYAFTYSKNEGFNMMKFLGTIFSIVLFVYWIILKGSTLV